MANYKNLNSLIKRMRSYSLEVRRVALDFLLQNRDYESVYTHAVSKDSHESVVGVIMVYDRIYEHIFRMLRSGARSKRVIARLENVRISLCFTTEDYHRFLNNTTTYSTWMSPLLVGAVALRKNKKCSDDFVRDRQQLVNYLVQQGARLDVPDEYGHCAPEVLADCEDLYRNTRKIPGLVLPQQA